MSATNATERYIETTQTDGRLLVRFVARRSDRTLPGDDAAGNNAGGTHAVLFVEPAAVAAAPAQIDALVGCVDALSRRAAPANVRSIRLTATYLGIAMEDGEPPPGIRTEARWIRFYMGLVAVLAVVLLLTGIGLLVHMDGGRRLLQQLKDLRQQETEVRKDMATLALDESVALGVLERTQPGADKPQLTVVRMTPELLPRVAAVLGKTEAELARWQDAAELCGPPLRLSGGSELPVVFVPSVTDADLAQYGLSWWREPVTAKAADICRRFADLRVRLALLYTALADWNCRSFQMFQVLSVPYGLVQDALRVRREVPESACGAPSGKLPPEVGMDAWRSHETMVTITSSVVAGFLLPLLLGCLGGCAYGMRRVDQKLSTWTLEPQDGRHAMVRVALAAVLGGLLGVVWTGGEPVSLGGFSLSLAAAAFFIGFSVEPVFKLIEATVIEALLARLAKRDAPPPPAAPQ